MPTYSHTQKQPLWAYIVLVLFAVSSVLLGVARGLPSYKIIIVVGGLFLFLLIWLQTNRFLTVEVTDRAVTWRFSKMNQSMGIALIDIASAEVVHYTPLIDLLRGRFIAHSFYSAKYDALGYTLSVYSRDTSFVKLTRKDNSTVLIGTDDPQGLLSVIQSRLAAGPHIVVPSTATAPSPAYAVPRTGKEVRSDVVIMVVVLAVGLLVLLAVMWWGLNTP